MPTKLCSWDCEPDEAVYSLYTIGNVNEVLPGITTPLYVDLASWWDYYWTTGIAENLGVRDLITIKPPPFFNQLGFLGGRWTISISFNMACTATWTVEGSNAMLSSFFEGGDSITAEASGDKARATAARAIISEHWRGMEALRATGDAESRERYASSKTRRLDGLTDAEIAGLIDDNTRAMGRLFETHYYVSVGGGEYAAGLGTLLGTHWPDYPAEWVTLLTSALRHVESARPGKAIWDLSRLIAARPSLAAEVSGASADEVMARLAVPPNDDWVAFASAYRAFIEEFGWRGYRESDPATPTWDENPHFVVSAIKVDLAAPASADPHAREEHAAVAREALEAKILAKVPADAQSAVRDHLHLTQVLAREREAVKANWARCSRAYRPLARELGRRWAARGILAAAADIWFVRLAELQAVAAGQDDGVALKAAVVGRREEFTRLEGFTMPDGVFTWPAELVALGGAVAPATPVMHGLAISSGIARGRARVILTVNDETDIEPGEVLVAPVTDAPWTPLFIAAAAVIVEMGGVLSHSATVAREFGIPGVSGIKDATRIIKTGQEVTVDGNTGTVTIH